MAHLTEIEGKGTADLDIVSPQNLLLRVQRVLQKIVKRRPGDLVGFYAKDLSRDTLCSFKYLGATDKHTEINCCVP